MAFKAEKTKTSDIDFMYRREAQDWTASFTLQPVEKEAAINIVLYSLEMQTVLSPDGNSWNLARFKVKNHKLQFLELRMPPGHGLVALYVDDRRQMPATACGDADCATAVATGQCAARKPRTESRSISRSSALGRSAALGVKDDGERSA